MCMHKRTNIRKPLIDRQYAEARAAAQRAANLFGYDHGIERNYLGYTVFMLPVKGARYGRELTCEVVHPEGPAQPGHGA